MRHSVRSLDLSAMKYHVSVLHPTLTYMFSSMPMPFATAAEGIYQQIKYLHILTCRMRALVSLVLESATRMISGFCRMALICISFLVPSSAGAAAAAGAWLVVEGLAAILVPDLVPWAAASRWKSLGEDLCTSHQELGADAGAQVAQDCIHWSHEETNL